MSRDELLRTLKAFAESEIPFTAWPAWWLSHRTAINHEINRFAFLAIGKKGFTGIHDTLKREGIAFNPSPDHCPGCGELLFTVMPGKVSSQEIIDFAKSSKLKESEQIIRTGWLHPGQYCRNRCIVRLWNIR